MVTEFEENLCVRKDRDYQTEGCYHDATPQGYHGTPKPHCRTDPAHKAKGNNDHVGSL